MKPNIKWIKPEPMMVEMGKKPVPPLNTLVMIEYGGKYDYKKFYLNRSIDSIEKEFDEFMCGRGDNEIDGEGWDAIATVITFDESGITWSGNMTEQFQDITQKTLAAQRL